PPREPFVWAGPGDNYRLPPNSYDGRFRLCVKEVTTERDLEAGRGTTLVALEVAWDPELLPLYLETRPHNVRLTDDKNNTLTVPDVRSALTAVDGRITLELELHLPALPRSVSKISSLRGQLSMIGPSKMLTFNFDRLGRIKEVDRLGRIKEASADEPERRLTQE